MGQQPCANIDSEIRSLICLLNEAPYIQTHSCCSGHPSESSHQWSHGFITVVPIVDFCPFFQFLDELQVKLNLPAERPFELFQQVNASSPPLKKGGRGDLFSSTAPLLDVYCNFTLGATQRQKGNVRHWNSLLSVVQAFLQEEGVQGSVKTIKEGADILIGKVHATPHVQLNKTKFLGGRRVVFETVWRYNSCKWCWDLVEHVNKQLFKISGEYDWFHALYNGRNEELRVGRLDSILYGGRNCCEDLRNRFQFFIEKSHLFAHSFFVIQPVIGIHDVKRTREEHIQIWHLTELVAASLIRKAMVNHEKKGTLY